MGRVVVLASRAARAGTSRCSPCHVRGTGARMLCGVSGVEGTSMNGYFNERVLQRTGTSMNGIQQRYSRFNTSMRVALHSIVYVVSLTSFWSSHRSSSAHQPRREALGVRPGDAAVGCDAAGIHTTCSLVLLVAASDDDVVDLGGQRGSCIDEVG